MTRNATSADVQFSLSDEGGSRIPDKGTQKPGRSPGEAQTSCFPPNLLSKLRIPVEQLRIVKLKLRWMMPKSVSFWQRALWRVDIYRHYDLPQILFPYQRIRYLLINIWQTTTRTCI